MEQNLKDKKPSKIKGFFNEIGVGLEVGAYSFLSILLQIISPISPKGSQHFLSNIQRESAETFKKSNSLNAAHFFARWALFSRKLFVKKNPLVYKDIAEMHCEIASFYKKDKKREQQKALSWYKKAYNLILEKIPNKGGYYMDYVKNEMGYFDLKDKRTLVEDLSVKIIETYQNLIELETQYMEKESLKKQLSKFQDQVKKEKNQYLTSLSTKLSLGEITYPGLEYFLSHEDRVEMHKLNASLGVQLSRISQKAPPEYKEGEQEKLTIEKSPEYNCEKIEKRMEPKDMKEVNIEEPGYTPDKENKELTLQPPAYSNNNEEELKEEEPGSKKEEKKEEKQPLLQQPKPEPKKQQPKPEEQEEKELVLA